MTHWDAGTVEADVAAGGAGDIVCRFSRWTRTFYCTISTSRISWADPFPFHPTSNTIPYLSWICHGRCPRGKDLVVRPTHLCGSLRGVEWDERRELFTQVRPLTVEVKAYILLH